MTDIQLHKDIDALPAEFKNELAHIVQTFKRISENLTKKEENPKREAGTLKGKIWMSDDFDEPLEDFKDYM